MACIPGQCLVLAVLPLLSLEQCSYAVAHVTIAVPDLGSKKTGYSFDLGWVGWGC